MGSVDTFGKNREGLACFNEIGVDLAQKIVYVLMLCMCANVISTYKKDLKIVCTSFLTAWPKYLFLSVLYIKGSLVIVFLSCREEPGSTSLLYRKNSRLSCILSSLGRRFSGRTTQLLSPPHPILLLLFLFSPFPFSFLFPSLLFSLLLYFPPNPLPPTSSILLNPPTPPTSSILLNPPIPPTLPHLQPFPQITLPPWCIPVLRRAH